MGDVLSARTFNQENVDSLAQTWTNIDTLVDSDNDGISDYDEQIVGSPVLEKNTLNSAVIEVAFTVVRVLINF